MAKRNDSGDYGRLCDLIINGPRKERPKEIPTIMFVEGVASDLEWYAEGYSNHKPVNLGKGLIALVPKGTILTKEQAKALALSLI